MKKTAPVIRTPLRISEIASIQATLCKICRPLRKGVCSFGRSGKLWRRPGMVSAARLQHNCIPERHLKRENYESNGGDESKQSIVGNGRFQ